jgi:DNA-binding beta-propeller fold protein YncE
MWGRGWIFVPSNGGLYVASLAKIIEINPSTNAVIGNIPLGPFEATAQFAFDNTNGDVYVTNQSDDFVFAIRKSRKFFSFVVQYIFQDPAQFILHLLHHGITE